MLSFRGTAGSAPETQARRDAAIPDIPVDAAWFKAAACRNCGAPLETPYCGQCGQKAATRLMWKAIVHETWDRVRFFEMISVKTLAKLLLSPGTVAREYVMGRRAEHMHPLKLLVALVAVLVLLLAANQYFQHYGFSGRNDDVDRMASRVMALANWSFSLGIVAIFLGGWIVFRKRLGYNVIEHGVLAIYAQSIILAVIIVNMLPTLVWRDPAFIVAHKAASQYYLYAIKLLIVAAAYRQFFLLDLKSDWPRLAAACALYAAISWVLLRAYATAILWAVTGNL